MKYLSVCSGIEAATVAWHPLGWKPFAFSEIEKFPAAVLSHHYPDIPNFGDMTQYEKWKRSAVDVLVGGTPCQSFSVAGLRKGLDDPRGNLMLTFGAIAAKYRPKWVVWENVPGVLSSNGGRDFGTFLGMLGELGYGFAYRVLDAQFFGVAQRRRRVFVVGHLGDWRPAAAVLFERHSLSGNPAPSRIEGQGFAHDIAPSLTASGRGVERAGDSRGQDPVVVCGPGGENLSHCISARDAKGACSNLAQGTLVCHGTQDPIVLNDKAFPLGGNSGQENAVFGLPGNWVNRKPENGGNQVEPCVNLSPCLNATDRHAVSLAVALRGREGGATAELSEVPSALRASSGGGDKAHVLTSMQVRRLTPRECERLQGFQDDYTLIPWRTWQEASRKGASYEGLLHERGMTLRGPSKEQCPDGPRYKALGNSMAVPVMRWIGERIEKVEAIKNEN